MANIAKITNVSMNDISKIFGTDKSNISNLMGINPVSSGPSKSYNIDIDNTKIDSDLNDFPLLVNLSNSAGKNNYDLSNIFDTIGSDYSKLKIYDSNNTQLYTEVESWDATNKSAQLWVKVPSISSSETTRLTLDYSATSGSNEYISDSSTSNLSVDIGSEGTYDTKHVESPFIIKESDTSYKMWYTGSDGTHNRILYCTSTDGINWSNFQLSINIGSQGTYDTTFSFYPNVIKDGNIYKMWYTGSNGVHYRIIYCTSTDGINWSNFQLAVNFGSEGNYDNTHARCPSVIKESDTSYKMWYAGSSGTNWRIIYCTSTDGINWTNHQMVVNKGSEGIYDSINSYDPYVIKESDTSYKMWYTGYTTSAFRIIYCDSTDGINWTHFQMVVNKGSAGTYDQNNTLLPFVIKESDTSYKMWYAGSDGSNKRVLYATSYNGKDWAKNVVNRVWDDDFVAVYHMNQSPDGGTNSILDSTSNNNHGTPGGSMTNGDLVDGQIGKALEFDGTNDLINIGNVFDPTYYTLEAVFKTSQTGSNTGYSLLSAKHGGIVESCMYFDGDDGFNFITGFYQSGWHRDISGLKGKNDGNLHYAAATYDKVNLRSYIDDATHNTASTTTISTTTEDYRIGARWDAESNGGWWNGIIDEVRISKTARSADWIKATYHSNWDNLNYWSS